MEKQEKAFVFGRTEGVLLGVSLAAAVIFKIFHHGAGEEFFFPGPGLTLSQYGLMLTAIFLSRREGRLRWHGNREGKLLLALSLLLGLCYTLYFDQDMRWMNAPVLAGLSWQALLSLCGKEAGVLAPSGLRAGWMRFWKGLFSKCLLPFRFLAARVNGKKAGALLMGICLCVPVMAVVLLLLAGGDQIFRGALRDIVQSEGWDASVLWHGLMAAVLGLLLFSLLHSCLTDQPQLAKEAPKAPAAVFLTLLCAMALSYGAFAYIQVKYLFLGQESVYARGGYAEYARSGFFQLVLVAAITLCAEGPALTLTRGHRAVRVLCGLVTALTLVIDFSAFFRMRLYIREYGLSLLRLLTLWAMAMIALLLAGVLAKCVKNDLRVFHRLCAAVLCAWVLMNLCNPGLLIAKYNVSAYQRGILPRLDLAYLHSMAPDACPAFREIRDEEMRQQALQGASAGQPSIYDTSISCGWVEK